MSTTEDATISTNQPSEPAQPTSVSGNSDADVGVISNQKARINDMTPSNINSSMVSDTNASKRNTFNLAATNNDSHGLFGNIRTVFRRIFSMPFVRDPIAFCRADDFDSAGKRIKHTTKEDEEQLDMIEAICNYSPETKVLFEKILSDRRDHEMSKNDINALDFTTLAPWTESMLDRLESTFKVFDLSCDGLVDFEELTTVLLEFGDKSTPEDRRKVFDSSDALERGGLNFREFSTMVHDITVKNPDTSPTNLVETFRQIDRNMARIRSLDVVQQLQAGLF